MKKCVLILMSIALFQGCANNKTIPEVNNKVEFIEIIPVVMHNIDYASITGGALFGAFGVLAEQALVNDKRNLISNQISNGLNQEFLLDIASEASKKHFLILYPTAKFKISNLDSSQKFKNFNDWFPLIQGTKYQVSNKKSVVAEFGFQMEAVKRFSGVYAEAWVGVKLIDGDTGNVIGKSIDNSLIKGNGIKIVSSTENISQDELVRESRRAFGQLINNLTNSSFEKFKTP